MMFKASLYIVLLLIRVVIAAPADLTERQNTLAGTLTSTFTDNLTGNLNGTLTANPTGILTSTLTGNLTGTDISTLPGNPTGTLTGNPTGIPTDVPGNQNVTDHHGDMKGDFTNNPGNWTIPPENLKDFTGNDHHLSGSQSLTGTSPFPKTTLGSSG